MKPFTARRTRQRGAAILMAMLTVVLVATLASAALWQQWRTVEIESAERTRAQSSWVLIGALDWARLILTEDARKGGSDHLSEPWSMPLEQARLSTFLASDRSDTLAADASVNAFLSGQITDLQARLNLKNLIQEDGKVHPTSLRMWERLFTQLGLPRAPLDGMVAQLLRAHQAGAATANNPSPEAGANGPLWPQEPDQLSWLGLDPQTLAQLRPHITVLPERTAVNLNTASDAVLIACLEGLTQADVQRLVTARRLTPWENLEEVKKAAKLPELLLDASLVGISTRFFAIRGELEIDGNRVQEYSVVQRDAAVVKTLWRKRPLNPTFSP
ncbi:MAG: type II secretion system minor pseudopilin GspK [Rhodoferax sp.]|nr:type II secretion system minor pseudopilin GspK [Rhodoferax sp.]